jgi:membrane fusion protein (multidrug efflux system)
MLDYRKGLKLEDFKGILIKASPVLFLVLGYFGYTNWTFVDTDDAQVTADVIAITARLSGIIEKVSVIERAEVKEGDSLVQFDDHVYVKAVELAESQVSSAQAKLHEANTNQTKANVLLKNNELTHEQFAEIRTIFNKATSSLIVARAKVEQAKLNLGHTKILAPQDGNISKIYIADKSFVSKGQTLFGFVSSSDRWVIGNFRESQLARIKNATKAKVRVDGLTGKSYEGEVESIIKRTTPVFAQNPPERSGPDLTKNSTRTIVRIRLLNLTAEDKNLLQDGLSATISLTVR